MVSRISNRTVLPAGAKTSTTRPGMPPGALGSSVGGKVNFLLQSHDLKEAEPVPGPERRPRTGKELGVRIGIIDDLALKILYTAGPFSVFEMSKRMRVSYDVANEIFNRMRTTLLCQVTGMKGNIPEIAITTQGRTRALELLASSQYTGPAPVALEAYVDQVRKQSVRHAVVHKDDIDKAFEAMVLPQKTLWQIGIALNSGASIFLHGPAGVGKSAIAETMSRVLAADDVWIPWAVEADGEIIAVYDPIVHQRVGLPEGTISDERWARCQRPSVLVGGELTVEMLDLQFNSIAGFYTGPVQMKANNGVLIVDDFGRQRIRPDELLNRWVVPLDRRIDFLTQVGGKKIEIPFELLVVFATNLEPDELVDAAFLRRMQTKIKINTATEEQFCEIFRRVARKHQLTIEENILQELVHIIRETLRQELRGCQPRDLVNHVLWAARYEDKSPILTRASLIEAIESYFIPVE
jgi:predicted ATPase with chaperone activity